MITTPETNIKLSDNDALAIEEAQRRLLNVETLVSISQKNLRTIKLDTENVTRERLSQEELLNTLVSKNKELSDLSDSLSSAKDAKAKEVRDAGADLESIRAKSAEIEAGHAQREKDIAGKEAELVSRETSIASKEKEMEESRASLYEKHARINDFVASI